MNFIELVEQRKIEARKQNILEVRKDIDKSWVKDKINNHIQRFDGMFSAEDVRKQILENDLVASMFAKDPSKQNITEKLVSEILKIDKLPASGKSCVRFSESGELVSNLELLTQNLPTLSLKDITQLKNLQLRLEELKIINSMML